MHKRLTGQPLAKNGLSHFYEQLFLDRVDNLVQIEVNADTLFNETAPLLYTCLKLTLAGSPETKLESLHLISSLDSFREHDSHWKLLVKHLPGIYKPVEMIARLYVSDSLRYPEQAEYWLDYAHILAVKMLEEAMEAEEEEKAWLLANVKRV